jgi:acetyltransferase-like isoleucine patch superfamily enzyme
MLPKSRMPWGHLIAFGWLPSPLKLLVYRALGYRIGKRVRIGFGGVVVGRSVELGDEVEIGLFAVVQGRNIRIGRHSSIGMMSYIACEAIEIGEDAKIREQVWVGGPQLPESRFVLGSRTIILQLTSINPTKPVIIGDDTGIGGHCLIFTHGAWLNALDGYPVTYQPVTLGKGVWLPWRVFVMPGASIGDGAVIGANSLVTGQIPPNSLAVGSPAKVIKSAPEFPRALSPEERARLVADMVEEFDRYVGYNDTTVRVEGSWRTYRYRNRDYRLCWRSGADMNAVLRPGDTMLAETVLSETERFDYRRRRVHWLDLAGRTRSLDGSPLTEELVQFLGRYGIRLARDSITPS